ncbi:trypsin-like serine peptidase [Streptomyces chartreusis]|uniref:trypsin-like serine peptidase n=1 Tax=Streptomyces chartreusis TaxID=1969 RepID=UPI0036CED950
MTRRTRVAACIIALLLVLAGVAGWDSSGRLSAFSNPVVEALWTIQRMAQARSADTRVPNDIDEDSGTTDPEPDPVPPQPQAATYHDNVAVMGKIFIEPPDGPSVCSGTAVEDPARPGRWGLVRTAGHCVHSGAGGDWFRNIVFVPSYNNLGLEGAARQSAGEDRIAPCGTWWATWAETAPEWVPEGSPSGGGSSPFDRAVLHMQRQGGFVAPGGDRSGGGPGLVQRSVGAAFERDGGLGVSGRGPVRRRADVLVPGQAWASVDPPEATRVVPDRLHDDRGLL